MADVETWDDPETVETECGRCGNVRPCLIMADPFVREVYPEDLEERHTHWWCWPCYSNRADEA